MKKRSIFLVGVVSACSMVVLVLWWLGEESVLPIQLRAIRDVPSDVPDSLAATDTQDLSRSQLETEAGTETLVGGSGEYVDTAELTVVVQENWGLNVSVEIWHSNPGPDTPRPRMAYLTDLQGRLSVRLPVGRVRITAYVGQRVAIPVEVELKCDDQRPVVLVLGSGLAVEGVVVDTYSGVPIEGVRVEVSLLRERNDVFTNTYGRYKVVLPRDHTGYQIAFQAKGYAPDMVTVGFYDDGLWIRDLPGPMDVGYEAPNSSGYGTALVDFELVPEGLLRGSVRDPDFVPAAGARVVAVGYYWIGSGTCLPHELRSVVASDGSFSLAGIRSDTSYFLSIDYDGCATKQIVSPPTGNRVRVIGTATLLRPHAWIGRVIDANGEDVVGALIRLKREAPQVISSEGPPSRDCLVIGFPPLEVVTTEEGRFLLEDVSSSLFEMSVFIDGRRVHSQRLDMGGTEELSQLIRLSKAFYSITGRVVSSGQRVAGATIKLQADGRSKTAVSDGAGVFAFRGFTDDITWYQLQAEYESPQGSVSSQEEAVRAGGADVTLNIGAP